MPSLCTISGILYDQTGDLAVDVRLKITPVSVSGILMSAQHRHVKTNTDGELKELDGTPVTEIYATTINIEGKVLGYDVEGGVNVIVPSSPTANLADFISVVVVPSSLMLVALTIPLVNLNVTTKQTLYTVPTGKRLVVTHVIIREPSAVVSTAEFTVGFNALANNVGSFGPNALPASLATTLEIAITELARGGVLSSVEAIGTAGQVLGLKCSVPEGSVRTVTVDVLGYLA